MISLHIIADNAPPEVLDRALLYLKRTKQRYVNIGAGSQLDIGMPFVDRVRSEIPGIRILWRNLRPEDTGIHTKMSPLELYNVKVKPYLDWFKRHEIIFVPDNESTGNDEMMKRFAKWNIEVADLLHADGLNGAFARFPTGNPIETQYPLLKPLFDAFKTGDLFSPNEYSAQPGYPKGSGGNLERYKLAWAAAGWDLPTVIGEAGIAVDYDPGKGYQSIGMSSQQYAQQMLDEEVWYKNGAITRCLYLVGGHKHETYRINNGVYEYLEDYYAKQAPPVVVAPPPAPVPAPPPAPIPVPPPPPPNNSIVIPAKLNFPAVVKLVGFTGVLQIRSGPGIHFADLGDLKASQTGVVYQGTITEANNFKWIYGRFGMVKGWFALINGIRLELTGDSPKVGDSYPLEDNPLEPIFERANEVIHAAWLQVNALDELFRLYKSELATATDSKIERVKDVKRIEIPD